MRSCPILLLGLTIACSSREKPSREPTTPDSAAQVVTTESATTPLARTTAVFAWQTELCELKGNYDASRYTPDELKNTFTLWFSPDRLETTTTTFKPGDIANLDTTALDREYTQKIARLRAMKVVKLPYWLSLKQRVIRDLEQTYQLGRLSMRAYMNPGVLLNTPFSERCNRYAEAINGDETSLMAGWKDLADERNRADGNAAGSGEMFYGSYKPSERFSYARVELITFGWYNCANGQIDHVNRTEAMEKEFARLFSAIQSECSEP